MHLDARAHAEHSQNMVLEDGLQLVRSIGEAAAANRLNVEGHCYFR